MAVECRDYDVLFGKMLENNSRSRGLIDQFESIDIDVRKCCEMVADELVKKGLFEDAVKLYDLAEVGLASNSSYSLHMLPIVFILTVFLVLYSQTE